MDSNSISIFTFLIIWIHRAVVIGIKIHLLPFERVIGIVSILCLYVSLSGVIMEFIKKNLFAITVLVALFTVLGFIGDGSPPNLQDNEIQLQK